MKSLRSLQIPVRSLIAMLACAGALLVVSVKPAGADDAAELSHLLPSDINAIAIVRVEDIMNSPRAINEEWAKQADEKFLSGAGGIPSWVKTIIVGFLVRPAVPEEVWAASLARVPDNVSVESIAQRIGNDVETLAGMPAVQGIRDAYLLQVEPGLLGIWRPGIRQEAARWALEIGKKRTGPYSEYLTTVAARTTGDIVMAIDLENALDPDITRDHLQLAPAFKENPEAIDKMQALLMSLQGVILSVDIHEATTASLTIDFTGEIGTFAPQLRDFVLTALHEQGAAIDDLDKGELRAGATSVTLTTTLSDESLRRLVSLITSAPSVNRPATTPATVTSSGTDPSRTDGPSNRPDGTASAKYFSQVDRYLNDLERASRRSNDYSRTALWHEKFADKIDDLPIDGVDPDLVNYGSEVASKLRALGRSLRGQALEINVQQGTLTYDYNYDPGWASVNIWGGVGYAPPRYRVNSNLQQVRERQAAAITAGARQREQVWQMLRDERLDVLKTMRTRYGTDFDRVKS